MGFNWNQPQFHAGDKIASIVLRPPEIECGTKACVVLPHCGVLYAVQLPDGDFYSWFTDSELQSKRWKIPSRCLAVGEFALVLVGHGHSPCIKRGMTVKVIKVIPRAYFYDVKLEDDKYYRWLAQFEITCPVKKVEKPRDPPH